MVGRVIVRLKPLDFPIVKRNGVAGSYRPLEI